MKDPHAIGSGLPYSLANEKYWEKKAEPLYSARQILTLYENLEKTIATAYLLSGDDEKYTEALHEDLRAFRDFQGDSAVFQLKRELEDEIPEE